jgi:aminoglycoside phosphotransferase family enzyme
MTPQRVNVPALMQALQASEGGPVSCIETHISWVLLTPAHAYKVRKAVDLGFLDFTALSTRLQDCLDELRLNRRTAPTLYEGLVALRGPADAPVLERVPEKVDHIPPADILDYAVCMRRFDPGCRLDELLLAGRLDDRLADELADAIVAFHARAESVRVMTGAGPEEMLQMVHDNLRQIQSSGVAGQRGGQTLERYAIWARQQEAALRPLMARRLAEGHVKDAHGDLHLANICVFEGHVTLFDALEFDARLRCIDVIDDLAFLLMDLRARQAHRLARRVLNRYLDATGDQEALPLLRYFMAYRAMVRVKVARLTGGQQTLEQRYLDLVDEIMAAPVTGLVITHGLSGSGKTTVSQHLLESMDAVRVRSDVERQRLERVDQEGRYSANSTRRTYVRLAQLAESIVQAGYLAVIDAAFLMREQRDPFKALATRLGVPLMILHCQAPPGVLRERIVARLQAGRDASEADLGVLSDQEQSQEPLAPDEQALAWLCDSGVVPGEALVALQAWRAPPQPGTSTLEPG